MCLLSCNLKWDWLQPGMMLTHDEEVKKFFKHSSVTCVLAPRYGSSKLGYFKQQVNMFYGLRTVFRKIMILVFVYFGRI